MQHLPSCVSRCIHNPTARARSYTTCRQTMTQQHSQCTMQESCSPPLRRLLHRREVKPQVRGEEPSRANLYIPRQGFFTCARQYTTRRDVQQSVGSARDVPCVCVNLALPSPAHTRGGNCLLTDLPSTTLTSCFTQFSGVVAVVVKPASRLLQA